MSLPFYRHHLQLFTTIRASELHAGHVLALGNSRTTKMYGAIPLKWVVTVHDTTTMAYTLPVGAEMSITEMSIKSGLECTITWQGTQAIIEVICVIPSSEDVMVLA